MIMGGRNSSMDDTHRYGFNGKENDNEVKGEGVQQDYGFRIYDARVARFLSVDPLTKSYPSWSPYPFAMNRVIDGVDMDGLEFYAANRQSQDLIMDYIAHQFGTNADFSWTENRKLVYKPVLPQPRRSAIQQELMEEFVAIVGGSTTVIYAGDAEAGNPYFGEVLLDNPEGGAQIPYPIVGIELPAPSEGRAALEAITYTSDDRTSAVVLQDPTLSAVGRFELLGGGLSQPCASCIALHELLDHVTPWLMNGIPDQPGSTNLELVRRHSDALNNVGIQGRRSGTDHQERRVQNTEGGNTTNGRGEGGGQPGGSNGDANGGNSDQLPIESPRRP